MKIYVARRGAHYDVYDFCNPREGDHGFHWSEIDKNWELWDPHEFREAIKHPLAVAGFASDMGALKDCNVCVLVQPCGHSSHLEAGWAAGSGKKTIVYLQPDQEPELMLGMVDYLCTNLAELILALEKIEQEMIRNGELIVMKVEI